MFDSDVRAKLKEYSGSKFLLSAADQIKTFTDTYPDLIVENFEKKMSAITLSLFKYNQLLESLRNELGKLIETCESDKKAALENIMIEIMYCYSLVKHTPEYILNILKFMTDYLCYQSEDSDEWQQLLPYYSYEEIKEEDDIMKSYNKFAKWVVLGSATLSRSYTTNSELKTIFKSCFYNSLFMISEKMRLMQYK